MFRVSAIKAPIVITASCVLFLLALAADAQQSYENPGLVNGGHIQAPAGQFDIQPAAQSPFAQPLNQPVTVAAQPAFQQPQTTAQPAPQLAPPQPGRMTISVPRSTPVPTTASQPENETEPQSESESNAGSDSPGDEFSTNVEQGVGKLWELVKAAVGGNRAAQEELALRILPKIFSIIIVMFLANWLGNYARNLVTKMVSQRVDVTLGRFSGKLTKFAIMMVALMGILSAFKIELTSLAALIAAAGFAVGMALQGTLGSFAAGIALLVFRPFKVGDFISVDGAEGTVQAIELFTTAIDTPDNRRIIVPNESVFGNRIENWTHNESRRVEVAVGVAYSADMTHTREVLLNAIAEINGALPAPAPQAYLCELNASSVDWSCRVWCRPEDYLTVKERVIESVKNALDQNGIGIPFPQLDLHVVTPTVQQPKRAA